MQHKSLRDIRFPIFGVTNSYKKIWEEFGVLYIRTTKDFVLDNKNLEGNTLGERRAKIKGSEKYIPRITIFNVPQLLNTKYKTFIDSNGIPFKYVKHSYVPLTYHKVIRKTRTDEGYILEFKDTTYMVKVHYADALGIKYVGLLNTQLGDILYEFTDEYKTNTRKKI